MDELQFLDDEAYRHPIERTCGFCYARVTQQHLVDHAAWHGMSHQSPSDRVLEAVENEHHDVDGVCATCTDENDNPADWPCPTDRAVRAAAAGSPQNGEPQR